MKLLSLFPAVVQAAGPELRHVGRELTSARLDPAGLYDEPPAWCVELMRAASAQAGTSAALLLALAGELAGYDPAPGLLGGTRGPTLDDLREAGEKRMVGAVDERDPVAELRRAVYTRAHFVGQLVRSRGFVEGLSSYLSEIGRADALPAVWSRYAWLLLSRLPQEKVEQLAPSFAPRPPQAQEATP